MATPASKLDALRIGRARSSTTISTSSPRAG